MKYKKFKKQCEALHAMNIAFIESQGIDPTVTLAVMSRFIASAVASADKEKQAGVMHMTYETILEMIDTLNGACDCDACASNPDHDESCECDCGENCGA